MILPNRRTARAIAPALLLAAFAPVSAAAQEAPEGIDSSVERIRITLGPELTPAYPGADDYAPSPFFDFARARGDDDFGHEAPDEGFGFPVFGTGGVHIGPTLAIIGERDADDTAPGLREVDTTFEAGIALQFDLSERFYGFTEIRRGLGGHDAWTGQAGIDAIWRDGNRWLVSLGPRATWGDGRHARAYFGVSPAEAAASGLPAYDADGGLQSLGATLGGTLSLGPRWGIAAYAGYKRLVGDAADSPIVGRFGSEDQFSGGIALSYVIERRRD